MKVFQLLSRAIPALFAVAFLAACGGGDDDSTPPPPPAPSGLSYPAPPVFLAGTAITALTPTVTGTVTSYTITPALPAGLVLNVGTGVISGTPTVISGPTNYQVTAANPGGSTSASVSIQVNVDAASIAYPNASYTFTKNVAIAPITPSATGGAVVQWSIDHALPAGLTFNTTNGQISGTPTTVAAPSAYVVTATNSGGTSTANLSVRVDDVLPSITYPNATYTFTTDVAIAPISPVVTGGAVVQWSIDHALPAGLTFNINSGQISGTPTAVAASAAYIVTASNSGGSDTFNLSIGVQNGVLLDLGHVSGVSDFKYQGSRIVSEGGGRGIVWDAQTGAILASVDAGIIRDFTLAGSTAAFQTNDGFHLFSIVDGALLARIDESYTNVYWWVLGADGSYLCDGSPTRIACWTSSGTPLFTRAGDYRAAKVFGATGQLRVAKGPAGAQVIETIAVPSGIAANSAPFVATFHSWFSDGERFLSAAGNSVSVYSRDIVLLDFAALPTVENLAGQHNWFWTAMNGTLRIYAVGSGGTPTASYPYVPLTPIEPVRPGDNSLVVRGASPSVRQYIDLSGATPSMTSFDLGYDNAHYATARSATDWVFGTGGGVVVRKVNGNAPQVFNLGTALSITGSANRFAIATASGRTLYFDSPTRVLAGEIEMQSARIEISSDGTKLAAGPTLYGVNPGEDRSLRIYSLPSEAILQEWPYSSSDPVTANEFTMASSGIVLGLTTTPPPTQSVFAIDGSPIWTQPATGSPPALYPVFLSANGAGIAMSDIPSNGLLYEVFTNIYLNGTLATGVAGKALGWMDSSRLLVNRYVVRSRPIDQYDGVDIVNTTGLIIGTFNVPELRRIQPVSTNSFYSPERNVIYDLTGATLWSSTSQTTGQGAVAGNSVVFASGSVVRAEPR